MVKKKVFLWVLGFLFFTMTNAIFAGQTVYLAEDLKVIIYMRNFIKSEGDSRSKAIQELISKGLLKVITPEVARKKFGIKWRESELDIRYPEVVICFIGNEVGYGLFAMEDIKKDRYIAEYVGVYNMFVSKGKYAVSASLEKTLQTYYAKALLSSTEVDFSKITIDGSIDAEKEGNAARFAEHFPTEKDIIEYGYEIYTFSNESSKQDYIATANSRFAPLFFIDRQKLSKSEQHNGLSETMLIATKDIKAFEQIGAHYCDSYGFEFSPWSDEPYIFNKYGEVISRDRYKTNGFYIAFLDATGNNVPRSFHYSSKDEHCKKLKAFLDKGEDYIAQKNEDNNLLYIYSVKLLVEKLQTGRSRITIPCYYIKNDTNTDLFIETLEKIEEYDLTARERTIILSIARDNKDANKVCLIVEKHLSKKQRIGKRGGGSAQSETDDHKTQQFKPLTQEQQAAANRFLDTITEKYIEAVKYVKQDVNNPNREVLWGGDIELIVIANLLNLRVTVYYPVDMENGVTQANPPIGPEGGESINLWLGGGHYENYNPTTGEHTNNIRGDGNCLFYAVLIAAHKLSANTDATTAIEEVERLRLAVATNLRTYVGNIPNQDPVRSRFATIFEAHNPDLLQEAIAYLPAGRLRDEAVALLPEERRVILNDELPKVVHSYFNSTFLQAPQSIKKVFYNWLKLYSYLPLSITSSSSTSMPQGLVLQVSTLTPSSILQEKKF